MRITRTAVTRTCAICERTLLMGERTTRYAPDGENFVDVCSLCHDAALEYGWLKEGSPTTPIVAEEPRKRGGRGLGSFFSTKKAARASEPIATDPILRRLSEPELAIVEAADLFNQSAYRRTIAGIAKSLGDPQASVLPLSGVTGEVVLTIAWDISWYQYRVTPESQQPVKLAERGHELVELDAPYKDWNARLEGDGRLVPNIAKL